MKDLSNQNVIHIKKDKIQYLQFRKLLEYKELKHAYSIGTEVNYRTIKANNEKLEETEYKKAIKDYKVLCDEIGLNYINLVKGTQKHTDEVKIVNKKVNNNKPDFNLEKYENTDGLITNMDEIILAATNADCIILLLYDPITKTIANIHSGWKGTLQRIGVKAVEKMIEKFNCNPKDIICCICPSIRRCHFEVDKDVKDMFEKEFIDIKQEFISKQVEKEKWNIDTVLINKIILKEIGLKKENIIDSGICSVCESNLIHSYRVEKQKYGLNTALIGK